MLISFSPVGFRVPLFAFLLTMLARGGFIIEHKGPSRFLVNENVLFFVDRLRLSMLSSSLSLVAAFMGPTLLSDIVA